MSSSGDAQRLETFELGSNLIDTYYFIWDQTNASCRLTSAQVDKATWGNLLCKSDDPRAEMHAVRRVEPLAV